MQSLALVSNNICNVYVKVMTVPMSWCGNVVVKDSAEVSWSREAVDVHITVVNGVCDFSSVTPLHIDFLVTAFYIL
jgi:hypothetical protein